MVASPASLKTRKLTVGESFAATERCTCKGPGRGLHDPVERPSVAGGVCRQEMVSGWKQRVQSLVGVARTLVSPE